MLAVLWPGPARPARLGHRSRSSRPWPSGGRWLAARHPAAPPARRRRHSTSATAPRAPSRRSRAGRDTRSAHPCRWGPRRRSSWPARPAACWCSLHRPRRRGRRRRSRRPSTQAVVGRHGRWSWGCRRMTRSWPAMAAGTRSWRFTWTPCLVTGPSRPGRPAAWRSSTSSPAWSSARSPSVARASACRPSRSRAAPRGSSSTWGSGPRPRHRTPPGSPAAGSWRSTRGAGWCARSRRWPGRPATWPSRRAGAARRAPVLRRARRLRRVRHLHRRAQPAPRARPGDAAAGARAPPPRTRRGPSPSRRTATVPTR